MHLLKVRRLLRKRAIKDHPRPAPIRRPAKGAQRDMDTRKQAGSVAFGVGEKFDPAAGKAILPHLPGGIRGQQPSGSSIGANGLPLINGRIVQIGKPTAKAGGILHREGLPIKAEIRNVILPRPQAHIMLRKPQVAYAQCLGAHMCPAMLPEGSNAACRCRWIGS